MTPVKRLADILQDTLTRAAHFEQRYRDVHIRFVCYQKGQPVHQSTQLSRHHLQTELPQICRTHGATKLRLIITGSDHRRDSLTLYDETFRLARAGQSGLTSGGYGLGSPMPQPALSGMSHGGLGAAETAALVNKRVNDELLLKAHTALQKEAGDMRHKIAKLETELEEQVEVNKSRNMIKEYTGMITPFIPALGSLLDIDLEKSKSAPAGLGSIEGGANAHRMETKPRIMSKPK